MSQVLVIDDDPGTLELFAGVLRCAGFETLTAASGERGLLLLQHTVPDAVLLDERLPGASGLDVLRVAQPTHPQTAFVIVTAWATVPSAVEAMKLAAIDYVEKPLIGDDLVRVVAAAIESVAGAHRADPSFGGSHAAARLARALAAVLNSPIDPRTVGAWSRCAGLSQGTIKTWCLAASVTPRQVLNFGRLSRAILWSRAFGNQPQDYLDVVDRRTLAGLLKDAGVASGDPQDLPRDIQMFLNEQELVRDPQIIRAMHRMIGSSPFLPIA